MCEQCEQCAMEVKLPKIERRVIWVAAYSGGAMPSGTELNEALLDGWQIANRSAAAAGSCAVFSYELIRVTEDS